VDPGANRIRRIISVDFEIVPADGHRLFWRTGDLGMSSFLGRSAVKRLLCRVVI
jgi:hypothetical protein